MPEKRNTILGPLMGRTRWTAARLLSRAFECGGLGRRPARPQSRLPRPALPAAARGGPRRGGLSSGGACVPGANVSGSLLAPVSKSVDFGIRHRVVKEVVPSAPVPGR